MLRQQIPVRSRHDPQYSDQLLISVAGCLTKQIRCRLPWEYTGMNHRQRMLQALQHKEPDRVPIDFGGTVDSTIQAVGYRRLREHLGLSPTAIHVVDVYQQVAAVDEDVRRRFDVDVAPLFYQPRRWRDGFLSDGTPARLPDGFRPTVQADGVQVVIDEQGQITSRMPHKGHYFDPVHAPLALVADESDLDQHAAQISNFDKPAFLDKDYEELGQQAAAMRRDSDQLIVGFYSGHLLQAGLLLRGFENFFVDLLWNQKLAHALLRRLLEANLQRFEQYAEHVCPHIDVIHFEEDLGMEDRPLVDPQLYRRMVKPYQNELLRFVRSHCDALIMLHSDGAVAPLIPDFIEIGVDILNPVQVSARGMDPLRLKREFGKDLCFWGAGCDSQRTLPFGTPAEVADEVKRRIDELASGGGYVFAPIHNVQNDVPALNVVSLFDAALEHGTR